MGCVPTLSVEVVKVATPGLPASVPVPMVVAPSRKFTVPVGAEEPPGGTVAVKVTELP